MMTAAAIAGCMALLLLKFNLIWKLNVNWDEFFYLSQVHDLARGTLTLVLQALHTHLFRWLTAVGSDEMQEIVAGRVLMTFLLGATLVLVWRLASEWTSALAAAFAALVYVAMASTLKHGGSFRADSLLTPLVLLSLLLFSRAQPNARRDMAAGAVFGLAAAVTIKAALAVPVFIALALLDERRLSLAGLSQFGAAVTRLFRFGFTAVGTAAILTGAHWLSLTSAPRETAGGFALRSARKTLLDVDLVPQAGFLMESLNTDALAWVLVAAGFGVAIARRQGRVLAFGLSLLPILVYRNSFPYYYPVMLAPACVFPAIAFDALAHWVHRRLGGPALSRIGGAALAMLFLVGLIHVLQLWRDEQHSQREVIAAVHRIFPDPVAYIDHSGMIASFPKVNFFMSGWGLEGYRQRGVPFMPRALATRQPAFVLSNRPVLEAGHPASQLLLPEDREILEQMYLPYWGPVRVAGTQVVLPQGGASIARVPFRGRYRLETEETVLVDGSSHDAGDIIDVLSTTIRISRTGDTAAARPLTVRLVLAAARPAPATAPPASVLYTGL